MAIVDKHSTGTQLNLAAAWSGGAGPAPTSADLARWIATSNVSTTFTMGGSVTWGGIRYNDATGDSYFTNGTAVTLTLAGYADGGTTYFVDMSTAASGRLLATSGFTNANVTLAIGTASGVIDVASGAVFSHAGAMTGSGTVTKKGAGQWGCYVNSPSLTSPISLDGGSLGLGLNVTTAGTGHGSGRITMADGTSIVSASGTRYMVNPIAVRGNVTFSALGTSAVFNNAGTGATDGVDFDSTTREITITGAITMSAMLTGTAGFTKKGTGTWTISSTASKLSGNVQVDAGTLSFSSTVLANATVVPSTGTLSWSAGTTIGALSGSGNLSVGATLTVGSATANTIQNISATYSGALSGASAITKAGTGTWTLNGTSTHTGGFTISAGTLSAQSAGALGSSSTGAVTLASGATLDFQGSVNVLKTSTAINLQGGTVQNTSGDNTYTASTAPMTGSATTFKIDAGSLAFKPTVSGSVGIVKSASGTLRLDNAANTFTGTTTISAGTLEVLKLATLSANSSIGAPTLSGNGTISMAAGTTLKHVGANEVNTTDRIISGSAAGTLTIDSSGTGTSALTLSTTNSGAITPFATGNSTVVFTGANTVANTCARTLANPASSGTLAVTKSGSNTWNLTGTLSHTGTTTVTAGELQLGQTNRTISTAIAISGGTLSNSTNTVDAPSITMTGGTLTAPLTGTGTLTINSGSPATVQPNAATGSNAQTGAITVSASAVVRLVTPDAVDVSTAGNGRAIGNGDVTCAGTIRTATSSTSSQRGQARYKSLTLNSGARLEIGAA